MFKLKKPKQEDIMTTPKTKEQELEGLGKEIEEKKKEIEMLKKFEEPGTEQEETGMPLPPPPIPKQKETAAETPKFYTANDVMQGLKEFYQEFKKDITIISENQVMLNTTMLKIVNEYEQVIEEPSTEKIVDPKKKQK